MHDRDGKHDHEHSHEHTHEHEHDSKTHSHEHTHSHTQKDHDHSIEELHETDNKDMQTLYVLLGHWVDHNKSHSESFLEWATKAESNMKSEIADLIRKAVASIEEANSALEQAKQNWK